MDTAAVIILFVHRIYIRAELVGVYEILKTFTSVPAVQSLLAR